MENKTPQKLEIVLLRLLKMTVILALFTPLVLGPFGLSFSEYPKAVYFRALTELALILWLALLMFNTRYAPKLNLLTLSVLLFFGSLTLSSLLGFNFTRSLWGGLEIGGGLITMFHYLGFFLLLSGIYKSKEEWFLLLKWVVGVGFLSTAAGFLQKAGGPEFYGVGLTSGSGRISGTLSNPVYFGAYMLLNIFLGLYLLAVESRRGWKIIFGIICVLNFAGLLMSGARGAFAGLTVASGVFSVLFLFAFASPKLKKFVLGGALLAGLIVLFFIWQPHSNINFINKEGMSGFGRIVAIFDPASFEGRFPGWETAVRGWRDKPLLGWGAESFNYLYDKYYDAHYLEHFSGYYVFFDAHNVVLNLLAEGGIFGAASYILIFAVIFYFFWKSAGFKSKEGMHNNMNMQRLAPFFLIALFAGYFFQNLFAFDTVSTYVVFLVLVAFIGNNFSVSNWTFKSNKFKIPSVLLKGAFASAIVLTIFAIYFVNLKPALASYTFARGFYIEGKNFGKALEYYNKSLETSGPYKRELAFITVSRDVVAMDKSFGKDYISAILQNLSDLMPYMETQTDKPDMRYLNFQELLALSREWMYLTTKNSEMLTDAKSHALKALEFNDQWLQFYYLLGRLAIYEGKNQESEEYFEKGFKLTRQDLLDLFARHQMEATAYWRISNKEETAHHLLQAVNVMYVQMKHTDKPITFKPLETEKQKQTTQSYVSIFELAAWLNWQLGETEIALDVYKKALEIYPEWEIELKMNLAKMQGESAPINK